MQIFEKIQNFSKSPKGSPNCKFSKKSKIFQNHPKGPPFANFRKKSKIFQNHPKDFRENPKFFKITQRVPPLQIFEKNQNFSKSPSVPPPFANFRKFSKKSKFFKITQRVPLCKFSKKSKIFPNHPKGPLWVILKNFGFFRKFSKVFEKIQIFSKSPKGSPLCKFSKIFTQNIRPTLELRGSLAVGFQKNPKFENHWKHIFIGATEIMWNCSSCEEAFANRRQLLIHREQKHSAEPSQNYKCGHCCGLFTTSRSLVRHLKSIHRHARYMKCSSCPTFFGGQETLNQHWADNHGVNGPSINTERVQKMGNMSLLSTKQSVRGFFQTFRFTLGNEQVVDPFEYFVANERGIVNFVNKQLDSRTMKFSVCVRVDFSKPISLDKTTSYFNSVTETVSRCLSEEEFYRHVDQILTQISIFCTAGSGWVIERMAVFDVKICKYSPMRAATYIPTPKKIQKLRRTVLNIQNLDDSLCFVYCILAALFPVKTNQQRPSSYKSHLGALYFNKKKMPMPLSGIPAFEKEQSSSKCLCARR